MGLVVCAAGCTEIGEPAGGGSPDASGAGPTGDAAPADASTAPFTLVFGDTDDADITGVTVDTYLDAANPTLNYGGAASARADADPARVALFHFDVSAIAPGSTVTSAELALTTDADALELGSIQVYEVTESWSEGKEVGLAASANWTQRTNNQTWTSAGAGTGSRATTAMTELIPNTVTTRYTVTLPTDLVQRWVDSTLANNGVVLIPLNADTHGVDFQSSESATTASRPTLTITATPAP